MTPSELFAAMSPTLSAEIIDYAFAHDKPLYKVTLNEVAGVRKVRPVYLERQPRAARYATIASTIARPGMAMSAGNLLTVWLLKKQTPLLIDFLDALKIKHENGVVEDLPKSVPDEALHTALETLLAKYPHETVAVYLFAFNFMNDAKWANLDEQLYTEPRLMLGQPAAPGTDAGPAKADG